MRYIGTDRKVVELEWDEEVAKEEFDHLLNAGVGIPQAVARVRANQAFNHLSDLFWDWLGK